MSGFELPVLIAAGSAAAPFCQKLAKKIKKYLLKRAEKEVDERVFRKGEKAEFESGLRDLAGLLESVVSNPAVDDPSVRDMLDGLGKSIKVAADAKYTEGREDALKIIDQRKNNLILALLNVTSARVLTSAGRDGQGGIETLYTYTGIPPSKSASFLGGGAFATVHTMRNAGDKLIYAVKLTMIKGATQKGITVEKLREEAVRLHSLNHSNIVRYYAAFTFKDDFDYFAIVMEHLTGGSLLDRLEKTTGALTSDEAPDTAKWARQVASALAHMHAQRMQHRDLKPDNVLFNGAGDAKVIDLGLAIVLKKKSRVSSRGGANAVGALLYQSPEKARGGAYDEKDDVWALGCMLAGAVTGRSLEARDDKGAGLLSKDETKVKELVRESKRVSPKFGGLVAKMLEWNPRARPTAASVEESLRLGKPLSPDDVTVEETRDTPKSTNSIVKRIFGCCLADQSALAEAKAGKEKTQREAAATAEAKRKRRAAEAKAAAAERKLRDAEAKATREGRLREAAAAAEAERRRAAAAEAERRRRAAEAETNEEKRQRLVAEARAAEAERKLRAAEARAAEERRQRAAEDEAERQRRARAKAAKDEEDKRQRRAKKIDLSKLALVRTLEGHSESVRCGVHCTFVTVCLRRRSIALPCFRTGGASCLGRTTTRSRCGTWRPVNAWRR